MGDYDNMNDENKIRDSIDAVTGLAKVVPIYDDLVQPAAKELGKGLATIAKAVNVALAPVSGLVWGYEKCKDFVENKVASKLQNVPPERLITPQPSVAGPAIEALRYTGYQDEIADMFANLLASAMTKETSSGALPSFVEIIKQLSPDEAKLLKYLFSSSINPLANIRQVYENGGFEVICHKFSLLGVLASCEAESLTPTYLDNLERLGLIYIPEDGYYTHDEHYAALENHQFVLQLRQQLGQESNIRIELEKKILYITNFGKQFCKICCVIQ